jgi:hypothetical protein
VVHDAHALEHDPGRQDGQDEQSDGEGGMGGDAGPGKGQRARHVEGFSQRQEHRGAGISNEFAGTVPKSD